MKVLILLSLLFSSEYSFATKNNYYYSKKTKDTSISVGSEASYVLIESEDEVKLEGFSNNINIGIASSYFDKWLVEFRVHFVSGPNEQQSLKVDYTGNSISARASYSFSESFRPAASYGSSLAISYQSLTGENPLNYSNTVNNENVSSWKLKAKLLKITPSLYYRSFKSKRNITNDPEYLKTRIEGWMISLGISVPVHLEYSLSKTTDENSSMNSSGKLYGYDLLLSGSVFLGI